MWKKNITKYVSKVQCNNYRLQATKFSFPSRPILLINCYFPCDPRTENFNDCEVVGLLADLQSVIRQVQNVEVLLAGDLNCHFQRQSRFSIMVKDSLADLGLTIVWQNPDSNPQHSIQALDYTHCSVTRGVASYSTIDHFVTSPGIFNAISDAGVIHSQENTSNHSAIYMKVKIGDLNLATEESTETPRVGWAKASKDAQNQYKAVLADKLNSLHLSKSFSCLNVKCQGHSEDMEYYTMEVMEAMEQAAKECLPTTCPGKQVGKGKTVVAGWTEHVKPYAEDSKFWGSIWASMGKPNSGDCFEMMKNSKRQYKYAVRRLKKVNDKIRNDKFVASLLGGGTTNIFKEIRKIRGTGTTCSSRIDEEVGRSAIANHFASIYNELYNRVDSGSELDNVRDSIEIKITGDSVTQLDRVNEDAVRDALKVMKANKQDGVFNIVSDCMINGPPELVTHLTKLLKLFISHGSIPSFILLCTLMPLVKDNLGDITSSENYRAIAGGSLLLKLLDIVILQLEGDKLDFDQMQFAYQSKASTTMCSWTVTAVVDHFNRSGSPVYSAAMDMSKAFDLVEWEQLFTTLIKRKVEPLLLRLILYIYTHQKCNVTWGNRYSTNFSVSNGVRQGAISSAILFAVYIDEILDILRSSGFGCHIHGVFFGAMVFADDIILLSATITGLQTMVDLCNKFTASRNLKFGTNSNAEKSKTKCIVFSKNKRDWKPIVAIKLNEDKLPWVDKVKHLGNVLQNDNSMSADILQKRAKFIAKVNSLLQEFHYVTPDIFLSIVKTYATSFYGSGLWNLSSAECERLYTTWNVSIRQIFNLDRRTHRNLIEPVSDCIHLKVMLASRFTTFLRSLVNCSKVNVRFLVRLCQVDQRTVIGKNISSLLKQCGLPDSKLNDLNSTVVKNRCNYFKLPETEEWKVSVIRELIKVRSGQLALENMDNNETNQLIYQLCTE